MLSSYPEREPDIVAVIGVHTVRPVSNFIVVFIETVITARDVVPIHSVTTIVTHQVSNPRQRNPTIRDEKSVVHEQD